MHSTTQIRVLQMEKLKSKIGHITKVAFSAQLLHLGSGQVGLGFWENFQWGPDPQFAPSILFSPSQVQWALAQPIPHSPA